METWAGNGGFSFGKPRKGIIFWPCFITQHHKASSIKEGLGKRESKLQIQGCSFVFLSVMTEAAACFRGHPRTTYHTKAAKDGFVRLLPASQLQASRQRGTTGKWKHGEAVGNDVSHGLGGQGCRRIWLPSLVQSRAKMHGTGRGGWGMGCFTPSEQEQMGLRLNTTRN